MTARFKSGTAETEIVGQEARERLHLSHDQEPAGAERGEHLGEDAIGIGHVVQGRRCPHQVNGVKGGPRRVEVRLDGADPASQAEERGLGP